VRGRINFRLLSDVLLKIVSHRHLLHQQMPANQRLHTTSAKAERYTSAAVTAATLVRLCASWGSAGKEPFQVVWFRVVTGYWY
jgi:hypothetical protein